MIGLDVLRAAAILGVLVMHLADREAASRGLGPLPWAGPFGFFGVELFFILSGFLIGRILIGIAETSPNMRAWGVFLVRRWMRTLPLYFLWLALLLVVAPPASERPAMVMLYATFTQNLAWPTPQGWFPVTWSLTTEEWFYLLFSTLLLGLAALRIRGAILVACGLFLVLPLIARVLLVPAGTPFDTGMRQIAVLRLDAIAVGVVMAWAYLRAPAWLDRHRKELFLAGCFVAFAPVDLPAIAGNPALFDAWAPFLLSFTPIGFALCIPAALAIRIPAPRLAAMVRWLSERSYCLYVVHLTIIDFVWSAAARLHLPTIFCAPIALLVAAGLADLSFRYFETPILKLRPRQSGTPVAPGARSGVPVGLESFARS